MNYIKVYVKLCMTRQQMNRVKGNGEYFELHHIIPRWQGGDDTKDNLVLLTAREHYIAHYLLFLHYQDRSSAAAFAIMNTSVNNEHRDSRKYEELRLWQSNQFKGDNNPARREDVRVKISKAVSGKKNGMYGRTGKKNPFYGKKHSKEFLFSKSLAHSYPVVADTQSRVLVFATTKMAAKYFGCTRENIQLRIKSPKPAKFGKLKGIEFFKIGNTQ